MWFENEGFSDDIARMGSTWGVRLKPFYMFTGADATTPLPGYARTKRATRLHESLIAIKVSTATLSFGGGSLRKGAPAINLSQVAGQDLLLEGLFLSRTYPRKD